MGVQMRVVTAQATSVTGCEQLFDEEQGRAEQSSAYSYAKQASS